MKRTLMASALAAAFCSMVPAAARAAESADLAEIRAQLQQMKSQYEARIRALEERLQQAEAKVDAKAEVAPSRAEVAGAGGAGESPGGAAAVGEGAFNPAVSLILAGTASRLSRDPATYRIGGFIPGGDEIGPGTRGFSLAESELAVSANIDPDFRGSFVLSLSPDNQASVEEATVQTIGLSNGLTVKAGRFFSGIGYLNEQHAHAWDFVDAPLAYQAFLGRQLSDDGVQLRWLAPTETFLELGAEAGRGRNFPGSNRDKNGSGLGAAYVHVGGDLGDSHAWRAGLSHVRTRAADRRYDDVDSRGTAVSDAFSGASKLWMGDFVWKWAPGGNARYTNLKVQGEYFRRTEDGTLDFNAADAAGAVAGPLRGAYASTQSGWYLQGAYQFAPAWRVGLRHDRLDSGSTGIGLVASGALGAADFPLLAAHTPTRNTLMVDYSPSEFSRLRLQFARDEARLNAPDNQLFLQYIMSLGAHGAHKF